jgi:hypothetical protein
MRVYIAQLQTEDETLLTIGSMAHPRASDIAIHPYHATLLATTTVLSLEVADALETKMLQDFSEYRVTPKHLEDSTWAFFTYTDSVAQSMIEHRVWATNNCRSTPIG